MEKQFVIKNIWYCPYNKKFMGELWTDVSLWECADAEIYVSATLEYICEVIKERGYKGSNFGIDKWGNVVIN